MPPTLANGYAHHLPQRNWRAASDERWDLVCVGSDACAASAWVGQRYIDGTRCNVWRVGKVHYAQTTFGD